ncbi:MAG: tetratricopeptide repeat protein [bacterium]
MKTYFTTTRAIALLLFFLALGVYANALGGDFIGDDYYFVVQNRGIETFAEPGEFFLSTVRTATNKLQSDVYRPLTVLSFAVTRFLFGTAPLPYHLINNILHALNAVILFFLFRKITGGELKAAFAAAIFAVHPVQTEAVSWISGRGNVQYTFFLLLSFFAFARWRDGDRGSRTFYVAALALYVLSMFSKEHGIVLPALLLVWVLIMPQKISHDRRRDFQALLPFFLLGALFLIIRTYILGQLGQEEAIGGPAQAVVAVQAAARYLWLAFFPAGLTTEYDSPFTSLQDLYGITSGLCLSSIIAVVYMAIRLRKRSPIYTLGAAWFFIAIAPVIHIVPIRGFLAERFLYLSIAGISLVITQAVFDLAPRLRLRNANVAILSLILVVFSSMTVSRNFDWQSPYTINMAALRVDPDNRTALYNIGVEHTLTRDQDAAIAYFLKAMGNYGEIDMYARNNIVRWFIEKGDIEKAFALNADNMKLYPYKSLPYITEGALYLGTGKFKAAEAMLLTAMNQNPESYHAAFAMAELCRITGRQAEAEEYSRKASQMNPINELTPMGP